MVLDPELGILKMFPKGGDDGHDVNWTLIPTQCGNVQDLSQTVQLDLIQESILRIHGALNETRGSVLK